MPDFDPHEAIPGYERRAAYVAMKIPDERGLVPTLVCCPRDRAQIPLSMQDSIRPINVSDTLVQCWSCGDDCWMSDGQRQLAPISRPLCFGCLATAQHLGLWNKDNSMHLLAPRNRDNRPGVT